MKKYLSIIIFLLVAIFSYSQTDSYDMFQNRYVKVISDPMGSAVADTLHGTTAVYLVLNTNKPEGTRLNYDHYLYIDSLGNGANVTVTYQGSNDNSTWRDIGTSQLWYVTSADTTLRFTNKTAVQTVTSTIASHTETTAAATDYIRGASAVAAKTDYIRGFINGVDSLHTSGVGDYLIDDTVTVAAHTYLNDDTATVAQRVTTVAAQTITTTIADNSVTYTYHRFKLLGAGSTSGADITKVEWAFIKPEE